MNANLLQTPLHDWHAANGGRMVDFAGWSMPVQYNGIVAEHTATRTAATLFDVSHMARLELVGVGAEALLDSLTTRKVVGMNGGRIRYSLMCNEQGGILDDILIYHLEEKDGQPRLGVVANAGNRNKIVSWIQSHVEKTDGNVTFHDKTEKTAMIAVQGPQALALVKPLVDIEPEGLKYYTGQMATINGVGGFISRTGYTGEDGCELIVPNEAAVELWETLIAAGATAAGLGARDTLRLEAGMPLYGHELNEGIDPIQAGLGFAVNLKDRDFFGRDAIAAKKENNQLTRVGIVGEGKRPFRDECLVFHNDENVGVLTSGTFSPTFEKPIGMAYVPKELAADNTEVEVDIRGKRSPARITKLPFYTRSN